MQRSIALLALLVLTACASPWSRTHRYSERHERSLARKLVVDKRERSMLVAYDHTVCLVTPQRFRSIQVGDDVWCGWRREGQGGRVGGPLPGSPPLLNAPSKAVPPVRTGVRTRGRGG